MGNFGLLESTDYSNCFLPADTIPGVNFTNLGLVANQVMTGSRLLKWSPASFHQQFWSLKQDCTIRLWTRLLMQNTVNNFTLMGLQKNVSSHLKSVITSTEVVGLFLQEFTNVLIILRAIFSIWTLFLQQIKVSPPMPQDCIQMIAKPVKKYKNQWILQI